MRQLSLVLIGGGDRGSSYLNYLDSNPDKFNLVGIAEPVKAKREYLRLKYGVPPECCFSTYVDLLALPKMADIAMICTQDKMHFEPAMMAIEKKYDLLLEKPIAPTPEECYQISEAAQKNGVRVLVCHVLRYTPFYKAVKQFVASGALGNIMNVMHVEGVGNEHMSHSYVRGNWRKESESSNMLLAKCCHDTDLFQWILEEPCTKVQSFGTLGYFCDKNKPKNAPMYCLDGCPHSESCYYYAPKVYSNDTPEVKHLRGVVANKFNPTDAEIDEILKVSPYGRCVYQCDNDVVDHQVLNVMFGKEKMFTLTMSAFNKGGRVSTIMGTSGELHLDMEDQSMKFYDFATRETMTVYNPAEVFDQSIAGGHGGGDMGIMADLYEYIANDNPSDSISDISVSCMSHLICFAAEESRKNNIVVDMKEYIHSLMV